MMPFYRIILKKAFFLSWRFKWLWFFGFFAAFIGNGSLYEALLRTMSGLSIGDSPFLVFKDYAKVGVFALLSPDNIMNLWNSDSGAFGMLILAALSYFAAVAVLLILSVLGQGATVSAAVQLDSGKHLKFRDGFALGTRHFWSVLTINVITKVLLLGALVAIGYLLSLININETANFVIYCISFILFVVFGIILYFLTTYGAAFAILRGKKPIEALKSAFNIFKNHVVLNLEMGFILFILNVLVGAVITIALFLLFSPLILIYVVLLFAAVSSAANIVALFLVGGLILVIALAGAWYSTFQLVVWALLFEELEVNGGKSKILRIFEHFKAKLKK